MKRTYGALGRRSDCLDGDAGVRADQDRLGRADDRPNAAFGEQLRRGASMAVEDINAAGGVNGQKLELVIGDDACDPKQATAVANKMVSDKVAFVAGHFCSGSSIPASDIYKEAKILQITPASTNPKLTDDAAAKGNTTVFRTCGRDDVQGATVGAYILKNMKDAKVAILHDKSPYGKGVADETKKALNKGGLKEAMYEAYNDTDKDFTALINKMKQAKIDIIVLGGYHTAGALIIKQSREQGLGAKMVGFDSLETAEFAQLGGAATNGVLMSFPPKAEDDPKNAALVKKFRDAKYNPGRLHAVQLRRGQGVGRCGQQGQVDRCGRGGGSAARRHLRLRRGHARLRPEGRHQEPGLRHLRLEGRQVVPDQEVEEAFAGKGPVRRALFLCRHTGLKRRRRTSLGGRL